MLQHAFVYFVLSARAFRAYVRVQVFAWRGSIILPSEEGPSPKRLVHKQLSDTLKSFLSLVFNLLHSVTHFLSFRSFLLIVRINSLVKRDASAPPPGQEDNRGSKELVYEKDAPLGPGVDLL